eukprot:CFRG3237T1
MELYFGSLFDSDMLRSEELFRYAQYSIELDVNRELFYGNDILRGSVVIRTGAKIKIPQMSVICECKYVMKQSMYYGSSASNIIFSSQKDIIASSFEIEAGETMIPFVFHLPSDMPASVRHSFCDIKWELRLVQGTRSSISYKKALVVREFKTSTLFHPLMGMKPTVQREVESKSKLERIENNSNVDTSGPSMDKNSALRVEVSLSNDTYSEGKPVDVSVAMHKNTKNISIRNLVACITQKVTFVGQYDTRHSMIASRLEETMITPRMRKKKWIKVATGGKAISMTFALLPRVPDNDRTDKMLALQYLPTKSSTSNKERSVEASLSPTMRVYSADFQHLFIVSYTVDLTILLNGAKDMNISIPFLLEGQSVGIREDCKTFPLTWDEPPIYDHYPSYSSSSYTTLRMNSKDTVFGRRTENPDDAWGNGTKKKSMSRWPFCIPSKSSSSKWCTICF